MKAFWITWFVVFLVGEAIGLIYGGTLSQTWRELRHDLPSWAGLLLSVGTFGAITWLFIHWAFSYWDKPGLDVVEWLFIIGGAIIGLVSFKGSRKTQSKERNDRSTNANLDSARRPRRPVSELPVDDVG